MKMPSPQAANRNRYFHKKNATANPDALGKISDYMFTGGSKP